MEGIYRLWMRNFVILGSGFLYESRDYSIGYWNFSMEDRIVDRWKGFADCGCEYRRFKWCFSVWEGRFRRFRVNKNYFFRSFSNSSGNFVLNFGYGIECFYAVGGVSSLFFFVLFYVYFLQAFLVWAGRDWRTL